MILLPSIDLLLIDNVRGYFPHNGFVYHPKTFFLKTFISFLSLLFSWATEG